jgi:hypothetical protein
MGDDRKVLWESTPPTRMVSGIELGYLVQPGYLVQLGCVLQPGCVLQRGCVLSITSASGASLPLRFYASSV